MNKPGLFYDGKLVQLLPEHTLSPSDNPDRSLNVLLIADVGVRSALDWSDGQRAWPLVMFPAADPHVRILEFRYNAPARSTFSWTQFIELGRILLDCMLQGAYAYELMKRPLLLIGHGLGGVIAKQAVTILHERYYDPNLQRLLSTISSLVFLGTPHLSYNRGGWSGQLDLLLSASPNSRLSKAILGKITEEVAAVCNVSSKFETVNFKCPVISIYETLPTKIKFGMFRSGAKILISESFATISLKTERVIASVADHRNVCHLPLSSGGYKELLAITTNILSRNHTSSENSSQYVFLRENAKTIWGSIPTTSQTDLREDINQPHSKAHGTLLPEYVGKEANQLLSGKASPAGATAGSEDISTFEIIPSKSGPVSRVPAPKLPCYILRQHSVPGECYGRNDVLSLIENHLLPPLATSPPEFTGLTTFALCGLGGVGKTQVAIEFSLRNKNQFDAIFWVYADTEGKLAAGFSDIAVALGLADELDVGNKVVNRDRVIEWLNRPHRRSREEHDDNEYSVGSDDAKWLLIFDNADDPELLIDYWPVAGSGCILITSRDPLAKNHVFGISGIDLEPFPTEIAASFLRVRTGYERDKDIEPSRLIAKRLGGHPLALTQVAGVLQRRDLSFDEFLEQYDNPNFLEDIHSSKFHRLGGGSVRTLSDLWAFEKLPPAAVCLLDLLSMMDADRIPETMFLNNDSLEVMEDFPMNQQAFEATRTTLLKNSLVKRDKDERELSVHRLIQDNTRMRMSPERFTIAFHAALDLVIDSWPKGDVLFCQEIVRWTQCSKLLPHIDRLKLLYSQSTFLSRTLDKKLQFADLATQVGWFHQVKGNALEAIPFLQFAETLCDQNSDQAYETIANIHFCMSSVLSILRDFERVKWHCEKFLEMRLSAPRQDDMLLSIAYNDMGFYYLCADLFEEALSAFQMSLNTSGKLEISKNGTYLAVNPRINSATALLGLGRFEEADIMVSQCLERQERTWGIMNTRSFATGETMYIKGNITAAQGRWDESYDLHKKALQLAQATIGNNNEMTANAQYKVAMHHARDGDYVTANQLLDDALRVWSDHPHFLADRARAMFKKSKNFECLGDELKAITWRDRAEIAWRGVSRNTQPDRKVLEEADFDLMIPLPYR